jgi:hypothetical protein
METYMIKNEIIMNEEVIRCPRKKSTEQRMFIVEQVSAEVSYSKLAMQFYID